MSTSTSPTPEGINELFQSACQFHQEGQLNEAKGLYLKLLEHVDAPLLHYNLGLIHFSLQEEDTACLYFERAHEGNPEDIDSLFNLALCQKNCGRLDDAYGSYRKLLQLDPCNVDALYNLAGCCREQRNDQEAIALYQKVLERAPNHQSATSNLAYMYQLTDDTARAILYYQKLLKLAPDHEAAQHMLASLLGNSSEAPPEAYIRDLFNNYSDHYEDSLVKKLQYNVPMQLRAHLDALRDAPVSFKHGIDLGCGTGLSAFAFKDIVTVFDGIDLSANMIALARKKDIYDLLTVGSITTTLQQTGCNYDFVLAADVFAYVGDLQETFRLLSARTATEAVFCFSTETGAGDSYALRPSGRFSHSPKYIQRLAIQFGWSVDLQQSTDLRLERGGWIRGNLWILRKAAVD